MTMTLTNSCRGWSGANPESTRRRREEIFTSHQVKVGEKKYYSYVLGEIKKVERKYKC